MKESRQRVLGGPRRERIRRKQWFDGDGSFVIIVKLHEIDEREALQDMWIGQWGVRDCSRSNVQASSDDQMGSAMAFDALLVK